VDSAHFETARLLRAARDGALTQTAGYVGVIDERLDLDLLAGVAADLPDWRFRIVGPVTKIDPDSLPRAENIEYPGMAEYAHLPGIMAGFDVALMPFALNDATRRISPTKTLEYLAAGLPVVSTRVPDVVADYTGIVRLADTVPQFARAIIDAACDPRGQEDKAVTSLRARHEWDFIAEAMHGHLTAPPQAGVEEDAVQEVRA
jgi:glycosyltransferase involved in cell wall biosynthesis